ncbi:MAG: 6-phosphogluconolactonase [Pedosphaera sp.]|nr:6-phosphogluconolactonase [Pedosphaera sp.]
MNRFQLAEFSSDASLATAAAADCAQLLLSAPVNGKFLLALSGGRIARRFCAELTKAGRRRGTNFPGTHFFWADERCVPPTDAESNFRIAQTALLGPLGIESDRIHRIPGESQPSEAASSAAEALSRLAPHSAFGQPILDLILLGMGEDGHVASLFPGEPDEIAASPEAYRPVIASKPPPNRITMSYGVLGAAREVWVLASGSGKEAALRQSLGSRAATPLGRVLAARSMTRILTDLRV